MESYSIWIKQLKDKIQRAQLRASFSVNTQLILLYWEIGESIVQKQIENQWGSKIVEKMAKDLKMGMSETNGFSRSNLFAMRKFYLFYKDSHLALISENELVQQLVGRLRKESILYGIPSIGIILCKSKDSIDVEYSLRGINKPLGISEFTYNELTEKLKENMPTVSELENELFGKK